jgi:hypothetical protein
VVEPRDVEAYSEVGRDRLLVLPDNRRGIAFSRNWIKQYSIEHGETSHWQLDDDVRAFWKWDGRKKEKCSALEAMRVAEKWMSEYANLAAVGYYMQSFVPSRRYKLNQQVFTVVLYNNDVDLSWRPGCIKDTDYSLQCLADGWCTVVLHEYVFEVPKTGTKPGGTAESMYAGDNRLRNLRGLMRNWPSLNLKIERGYGIPRLRLGHLWRRFPARPIKRGSENGRG